MLKRNPFIKHLSLKIQKKYFLNFDFFKKPKIFGEKNTSLILHPELAVAAEKINDFNSTNTKEKINTRNFDKENDKNLIIDDKLDFLILDSNGN